MLLCRFVLHESPDIARSGIFHENRIYETDGEKAIGIHDLSKVALLPPVGTSPSVRLFGKTVADAVGFHYANPTGMIGALGTLALPERFAGLNVRWAAIVSEPGEALSAEEAAPHVLAYTILVNVYGEPFTDDYPFACGPFLVTPDTLDFSQPIAAEVKCGEQSVTGKFKLPTLHDEIAEASQRRMVVPSELIASPPLPLDFSLPPAGGNSLQVRLGELPPLVLNLS